MCTLITGEVDKLEDLDDYVNEILIQEKLKDDGKPTFWHVGKMHGFARNGGELDLGDGWIIKFNLQSDKFMRIQLTHRGKGHVGKSRYNRTKVQKVEVIKEVDTSAKTETTLITDSFEMDDEEEVR